MHLDLPSNGFSGRIAVKKFYLGKGNRKRLYANLDVKSVARRLIE